MIFRPLVLGLRNIGIGLLGLCLVTFFSSASLAAPPCYTPEEVEAEQLLRLHSELMLVAITCRMSHSGRDLVKAYTQFTSRHVDKLREAEGTMSLYYEKAHQGQGASRLDGLRTRLANECGQGMAKESAPAYCAKWRDAAEILYDSSLPDLRVAAARLYAQTRMGAQLCKASPGSKLAKK